MYVSRVTLKNWKNFTSVDVSLSMRTFIVGPNAVGKSNLLDVFRFLRDIAKEGGGLQEAVKLRGGLTKIRCLAARAKADVEIAVQVSESDADKPKWIYEIGLTQKGGGAVGETRAVIRYEKVRKNQSLLLERPIEKDVADEELLQYTHIEQPTSNAEFRELADFFKTLEYQHIVPQIIRDPLSFQRAGNKEEFYGRDLLEKLNRMPAVTRQSQLRKIEKALKFAVPHLKNLSLEVDKMGIPHLQAIYEHWRPHGAKQNEEQFSDGTLRLIGLFFAMINGLQPLILEEPELSLHTGIVQYLAEIIHFLQKRKTGARQVILSTHSFELLNNGGIAAEEIILLKPVREGACAENAKDICDIKTLLDSGLTPAEVVLPRTETQGMQDFASAFRE